MEETQTRIYKTPIYVRRCIERYRALHLDEIKERARTQKKERYASDEEVRNKKKAYNKLYNERKKEQKRQQKEKEVEDHVNNILELWEKKLV